MVSLSPPYISELITVKPKSTYGFPDKQQYADATSYTAENAAYTWRSLLCCPPAPAPWNKLPAEIRNVVSLNSFKK